MRGLCFKCLVIFLLALQAWAVQPATAQFGQILFGEVRLEEEKSAAPHSIFIILYRDGGGEVGRQSVSNRSRYRFMNLAKGEYQLAVEVDNNEIARLRIVIHDLSPTPYGFQQDVILALKPTTTPAKRGVVSAGDVYGRSAENQNILRNAQAAAEQKKYADAVSLLQRIVENDKADFQAWTLLGLVQFAQNNVAEAEKAYESALEAKPTYVVALVNLAKLHSSQKNYEAAIGPLTRALAEQPTSAEANLVLGEAYLQTRRGSKAVSYLKEAAKLGRPEAHLRLGWLYDAAGRKDLAAGEYEVFLRKKPDYSDRKKLMDYISANRKD